MGRKYFRVGILAAQNSAQEKVSEVGIPVSQKRSLDYRGCHLMVEGRLVCGAVLEGDTRWTEKRHVHLLTCDVCHKIAWTAREIVRELGMYYGFKRPGKWGKRRVSRAFTV